MCFSGAAVALLLLPSPARAQEYRHLDSGRPVRIGDAATAAYRQLDLDLTSARVERLSLGRYRLQMEPRISYGIRPNTEISLRVPVFFRERSISPRSGIGGLGIGGEMLLGMETLHRPAFAIAAEAFVPTGPNALGPAFSAKALMTRTVGFGRVHLNASYGSYDVEAPVASACSTLPPDTPGCGTAIIPPIDGPCMMSPGESSMLRMTCMGAGLATTSQQAARGDIRTRTYGRWMAGIAADHAFPLRSIMLVTDFFAEQFTGIGRPLDLSAEAGARYQLRPWLVLDGGVGRHFRGVNQSTYVSAGTTLSRPLPR